MFGMLVDNTRRMFRKKYIDRLVRRGMKLGKNCRIEKGVNFDGSFPWLISIGDNAQIGPWVYFLTHDGSTKLPLGYTKIGRVILEDDVFIGARSIVLPNVRIGRNSIIAANSVVTKDIPANCVAGGNPCRVLMTYDEFVHKNQTRFEELPKYDTSWTIGGGITEEMKKKMSQEVSEHGGFIQ